MVRRLPALGGFYKLPGVAGADDLPYPFTMPAELAQDCALIMTDPDGVRRVAGTRVTLDTVAYAFRHGATPEEIVQRYPSLELADAYEAVTFYLRHRGEVDAYLAQREATAETIAAENERRFPAAGIRERLLARQARV